MGIRHISRLLRHSPGFAAITIVILAFSIGANTAVFSIIDGILLRPLAYRAPERLFAVQEAGSAFQDPTIPVSAYDFSQWRSHTRSFEGLALMDTEMMSLTNEGEPQRLSVGRVSANLFSMLGIQPSVGRNFLEGEEQSGRDNVVIISNALWRNRFYSDPQILHRKIDLDDVPYQIIGVMPADVPVLRASQLRPVGPQDSPPDLWRPFAISPDELQPFGDWNYSCIALINPGVSTVEALADLNAVQSSIAHSAPTKMEMHAVMVPLQEQITGKVRRGLVLLFVAVFVVLLIGCSNIANLVLVRANNRRLGWAIQSALGASRGRLIREGLIESIGLAIIGGLCGLFVAYLGIKLLVASSPFDLPRLNEVHLNFQMMSFAILISAFSGIIFGILPIWHYSRLNAQNVLKSGSQSVIGSSRGQKLRSLLVGLEVGLTASCLMAAGLLLHSFSRVMNVNSGFETSNVETASISLPQIRYPERPQRADFVDRLIRRLQVSPGVQSVAVSSLLPLTGEGENNIITVEGTNTPRMERPIAEFRSVNPDFFKTLGIPLKQGRIFNEGDKQRSLVVISEKAGTRLFPGMDPIGRHIHLGDETRPLLEIVGVVGDVRGSALEKPPDMTVYLPYWQRLAFDMFVAVHTGMKAEAIAPVLRREIQAVDQEIPVSKVESIQNLVDASVAQRWFQMQMVLVFAIVAALLTAVGIYSVVSYAALQRTSEMGVRMAMGATGRSLVLLILRQGMVPVVIGLIAGLTTASIAGRLMQSLLFEVPAYDPFTVTAVTGLLATVGAVACYLPARRAGNMNPLQALRYE